MVRHCVVMLFSFLSVTYSFSQNKTVTGYITDEQNSPVRTASVHILNTDKTVYTNADGAFIIRNLSSGSYSVLVTEINYASLQQSFIIKDSDVVLAIRLQSSSRQLDDVTVTAEKREENLQQLPFSISTLTSKQISDYRLWNSNQLTSLVPSLYADNSGDARNVTSIRGIVTTSYDPAVATYIDGVNQFTLDTYIGTLTDVERVEVLRGPQGTLYGRNAMGGVINIITRQPSNKEEAMAEVNVGNHGLQRYTAALRAPLIKDKLFAGVTFLYNRRDGYYHNDFYDENFDKQHLFYGNYFLKYLPGKRWMITADIKHQENRNNGAFPLVNGVEEAFNNAYHLSQDATAKMIDNNFNASLIVNHTGSRVNLSSISSYQSNYRFYNAPLDGDFSPYDVVSIINNYGRKYNNAKVFTQEIKVNSNKEKQRLQYTAGVYFFYQHNPVKQGTYYGELANAVYNLDDSLFTIVNSSKNEGTGTALYGQLQYAFTSKLKLIAGARYDYEYRKLSVESEYKKEDFSFIALPDTAASAHFHAFSPKLSLQYLFSKNNTVYFTYSKGYRAGGLSPLASDPSQPPLYAYLPENSHNFEIGSKNILFTNRLRFNVTAFTTYINNAQVPTLVLPEAITLIRNTGKLRTKGIEAELEAKPAEGLELIYNVGFTDTKYKSLKLSQYGNEINLEGKKQIFTPSATSMLAAQYSIALGKESKLLLRSEWQYKGKTYFNFANTIQQSGYSLFHARAGVEGKHIGLYVWARNIGNKKYIAYAYDFSAIHLGEPATYGVTINTRL